MNEKQFGLKGNWKEEEKKRGNKGMRKGENWKGRRKEIRERKEKREKGREKIIKEW